MTLNKQLALPKLKLLILSDPRPAYIIAKEAGIANPRISDYIHGRRAIPNHHLLALCEVFKCNPEDIFGEEVVNTVNERNGERAENALSG